MIHPFLCLIPHTTDADLGVNEGIIYDYDNGEDDYQLSGKENFLYDAEYWNEYIEDIREGNFTWYSRFYEERGEVFTK